MRRLEVGRKPVGPGHEAIDRAQLMASKISKHVEMGNRPPPLCVAGRRSLVLSVRATAAE